MGKSVSIFNVPKCIGIPGGLDFPVKCRVTTVASPRQETRIVKVNTSNDGSKPKNYPSLHQNIAGKWGFTPKSMVSQIFHRFSSTKKVCGDYCEGLSRETHTRQFCSLSVDFFIVFFLIFEDFFGGSYMAVAINTEKSGRQTAKISSA